MNSFWGAILGWHGPSGFDILESTVSAFRNACVLRIKFYFNSSFNSDICALLTRILPPPRSVVVRASARGAGGRGSIPDRVTPKT